ncbi:MAG: RNA 2',3'-cyclic phosphodiesterase [Actinomycetota bacterium]
MARNRAARPEAKPLRLFVAVDPAPDVVRSADGALGPWRERFPRGRWVRPENWHLTLKFLGRTWPRLVDSVHEACREAAAGIRPFTLSLDALGVFPRATRARVLWVGLEDPEGSLSALSKALDAALAEDFPPEKRGFTPHLTVARFDPPADLSDVAAELEEFAVEARPFRVSTLLLYQSYLSPRGARYEVLEAFPLGG